MEPEHRHDDRLGERSDHPADPGPAVLVDVVEAVVQGSQPAVLLGPQVEAIRARARADRAPDGDLHARQAVVRCAGHLDGAQHSVRRRQEDGEEVLVLEPRPVDRATPRDPLLIDVARPEGDDLAVEARDRAQLAKVLAGVLLVRPETRAHVGHEHALDRPAELEPVVDDVIRGIEAVALRDPPPARLVGERHLAGLVTGPEDDRAVAGLERQGIERQPLVPDLDRAGEESGPVRDETHGPVALVGLVAPELDLPDHPAEGVEGHPVERSLDRHPGGNPAAGQKLVRERIPGSGGGIDRHRGRVGRKRRRRSRVLGGGRADIRRGGRPFSYNSCCILDSGVGRRLHAAVPPLARHQDERHEQEREQDPALFHRLSSWRDRCGSRRSPAGAPGRSRPRARDGSDRSAGRPESIL